MKKWRCTVCGYIYDSVKGDPEHNIPPGTPFDKLPADWVCPVCGVGPEMFEEFEDGAGPGAPDAGPGTGQTEIKVGQKDPKAIQTAMFKLSYGLFIVTSVNGDKKNGQTANTVFQITSDPMRIALGINKSNLTHEFIKASGVVGVTILGEDGHELVRRFGYSSGRDKDKFAGVDYVVAGSGVPVVKGGIAFLEGKIIPDKSIDLGTHTLFIADVVDGAVIADKEAMTYAYFRKTK